MKANDALKKNLRALPWLKVEKNYVFTTNDGEKNLVELFQGRSQLFIKHFMMAPGQQWQCVGVRSNATIRTAFCRISRTTTFLLYGRDAGALRKQRLLSR